MSCPGCHQELLPNERNACKKCGWDKGATVLKIDYPDDGYGVFSYLENYKFPYKGWNAEFLWGVAIMKRSFVAGAKRFLSFPAYLLFPVALLLPRKRLVRLVVGWMSDVAETVFTQTGMYLQQPSRFCRSGRELFRVMSYWLEGLEGEEEKNVRNLIFALCLVWEGDNAYRYRGQDILGELDRDALIDNPAKEIRRLLGLALEREQLKDHPGANDVGKKWKLFGGAVLALRWLWPGALSFIVDTLIRFNLNEIRPDEGDWYMMCDRWDYNFGGKDYLTRLAERAAIDDDPTLKPPVENMAAKKGAQLGLLPNEGVYLLTEPELDALANNLFENFKKDWKLKTSGAK